MPTEHRAGARSGSRRVPRSRRRTPGPALCTALILTAVLPCPGQAATESLLTSPQLSGPAGSAYGSGIDVRGDFAVVSAPDSAEVFFHTRDPQTGAWGGGVSLSLAPNLGVGAAVALGTNLQVYYIARVASGDVLVPDSFQVRELTLLPSASDQLILELPTGPPDYLQVEGDVLVFGWIPRPLHQLGYLVYERDGNTWSHAFSFTGVYQDTTHIGYAATTDGDRVAVSDPLEGTDGAVHIWRKVPVRGVEAWVETDVLLYDNPLQGPVHFGSSLAMDGDCLAVGMHLYNSGAFANSVTDTGGATLWSLDPGGATYTQRQTIVADAALAGDEFGRTLALSGRELLLGSPVAQRSNANPQGDVSYHLRSGPSCAAGTWTERYRLRGSPLIVQPTADGDYGAAVAMDSTSGALVGDPLGESGGGDGAVYSFQDLGVVFEDGFESGDTAAWSSP